MELGEALDFGRDGFREILLSGSFGFFGGLFLGVGLEKDDVLLLICLFFLLLHI